MARDLLGQAAVLQGGEAEPWLEDHHREASRCGGNVVVDVGADLLERRLAQTGQTS